MSVQASFFALGERAHLLIAYRINVKSESDCTKSLVSVQGELDPLIRFLG